MRRIIRSGTINYVLSPPHFANAVVRARIVFCFAVALVPLRAEQPNAIQMEVAPQSLELASCDPGSTLLVIARNPSDQTAPALELSTFSDAPLQVAPTPEVKSLAPHRETSWQLQVTCGPDFAGGNLQIVLADKLARGAGDETAQIVARSVPVKLRDPQPLDNLAAIEIKSTLETLSQGDKGDLVLAVTNKTGQAFDTTITPEAPPSIKLDPASRMFHIAGLNTQVFHFTATANTQVNPGKQLVIFNVLLHTTHGNRNFVVTSDVDVGVLGASEILKLLGVPSLFLLPGFLAVSAFTLLWRWNVLRPGGGKDPPLEETKSGFWLVSITASLLIAGGFILHRHSFFSFYGLGDLMTVWFVSIGLGCAAYLGYRVIVNEIARRASQKYPQPGDTPVQVLQKLSGFGKKMDLDQVKVKGQPSPLFLLWQEDGFAYVCPEIGLEWASNADGDVQSKVQDQLTAGGDPGVVAEALEAELAKQTSGLTSGIRKLLWNSTDALHPGPQKIADSEIETPNLEKEILMSVK